MLDEISLKVVGKNLVVTTEGEVVSRAIGKNNFMEGVHAGNLSAFYGREVEFVSSEQDKKSSRYAFKLTDRPFSIRQKPMADYLRLNQPSKMKRYSQKDGLRDGLLKLSPDNRVLFRGKIMGNVENTIFHIVSNSGLCLDKIPQVSFEFFGELVERPSSKEKKLVLLKTLLQVMGWGAADIVSGEKEITVKIRNPPYGLQPEKDNWEYLAQTILGYLWLIDRNLALMKSSCKERVLTFSYSAAK